MFAVLLAIAIISLVALAVHFADDKTLFSGRAFATENRMKHYSADSRTVFVVFPREIADLGLSAVATVPLATAARISSATPVDVTVRKRKWGQPRVTSLTVL